MTISSTPMLPVGPGAPPTPAPADGAEAAADGAFALLLPDQGGDAKSDSGKGAEDVEPVKCSEDDAAPSPAEQISLAALLYAWPATNVVPLAPVSLPGAVAGEAEAVEEQAAELPTGPTRIVAPETFVRSSKVDRSAHLVAPDEAGSGVPSFESNRETEETDRPRFHAADFAAPKKAAATASEMLPANSSDAAAEVPAIEQDIPISQVPANPDGSLDGEQKPVAKKPRGTAGAKPDRDMNEASATIAIAPAARPATAAERLWVAPNGEAQPDQAEGQAQDFTAMTGGETNRGSGESSSFASPTISAPLTRGAINSSAEFVANVPKAMSPAAVLAELGLGLDRIQQYGNNRVDLHLSLEGGGEVNIELQMRNGAVHASILTGSPELREALQQGWSQLALRSESLGTPLADPVFKAPPATSAQAGQQDFRDRRHESQPEQNSSAGYSAANPSAKRSAQPRVLPRHPTTGLNVWA